MKRWWRGFRESVADDLGGLLFLLVFWLLAFGIPFVGYLGLPVLYALVPALGIWFAQLLYDHA